MAKKKKQNEQVKEKAQVSMEHVKEIVVASFPENMRLSLQGAFLLQERYDVEDVQKALDELCNEGKIRTNLDRDGEPEYRINR